MPYFSKSVFFRLDRSFEIWLSRRAQDFDVFSTQITYLSSTALFSRTAAALNKVYTYHQRGNLDPVRLKFRGLKKRIYLELFEKPSLRRADLLVALTEYEAQSYRALGLTNRIEVIPNGIGMPGSEEAKCGGAVAGLISKLGDEPVFLHFGRIHPLKGSDLFVEAFIDFARQSASGIGVLAGPDEFGLVETLRARISSAGLEERFFFIPGVDGVDKTALLKRADVFVLPTLSEGFSIALLEAMAAGCAVLTTSATHFDEIDTAGAGLIRERSGRAFARGLEELLCRGKDGVRAMGEKGREVVTRRYLWPSIVERYEDICRAQLESKMAQR